MSINTRSGLDVVAAFDNYFNEDRKKNAEAFAKEKAEIDKRYPINYINPNSSKYMADAHKEYNGEIQGLTRRFSLEPVQATCRRVQELGLDGIERLQGQQACEQLNGRAREHSAQLIDISQGSNQTQKVLKLVDTLEVFSCLVFQSKSVNSPSTKGQDEETLERTIYHLESLRTAVMNHENQDRVSHLSEAVLEDLTRLPISSSINYRDADAFAPMLKLAKEQLPQWLQPVKREEPVPVEQPKSTQVVSQQRPIPAELMPAPIQISHADDTDAGFDDQSSVSMSAPLSRPQVQQHVPALQQQQADQRRELITYFREDSEANRERLRWLLGVRDVASLSTEEKHELLKTRAQEVLDSVKKPGFFKTSRKDLGVAIDALEVFCLYASHSERALAASDNTDNDKLIKDAMAALEVLRTDVLFSRSSSKQTVKDAVHQINHICTYCLDGRDRVEFNKLVGRAQAVLKHFVS